MSAGASWAFDEDGQLAPPKPLPHDGVLLISCTITAGTGRTEARDRIRACVCKALSQWLGLLPGAITFISTPGTAPRLMIDGLPEPGFSISHEAGLSLAAVNLRGAVGVDVMRVQDMPDWHAVAQDYLGADVAAGLARVPGSMRPVAFARAWCEREACLKLHGVGLGEWGQMKCLEGVKVEVGLGEGLVGVMALHARG